MESTEMRIGLPNSARPSSRVLKPPGGGHSNIFAEPEVAVNAPRPKYNQQNSSNLNACMGSTDPNLVVEKMRVDVGHSQPEEQKQQQQVTAEAKGAMVGASNGDAAGAESSARGRVPPGGYSSGGFW